MSETETHLIPRIKQELVRVHSIRDGATDDGYIMEDDWGLRWVPGCELNEGACEDEPDGKRKAKLTSW